MGKSAKFMVGIDEFHFRNGDDYLDVNVNNQEGYLTLKVETTGEFAIESEEQLDIIYNKLKEMFQQIKDYNNEDVGV